MLILLQNLFIRGGVERPESRPLENGKVVSQLAFAWRFFIFCQSVANAVAQRLSADKSDVIFERTVAVRLLFSRL
jgi:hypothetical protein